MEEDDLVGLSVRAKLQTESGDVEGYTLVSDPDLGVTVLQKASATDPRRHDLKVLRMAMVSELNVTKVSGDAVKAALVPNWESPPPVNWGKLRQREQMAISRLEREQAQYNADVSREVQELFDALARTLPCCWDGSTIVVMDVVQIKEPYDVDDVETDNKEFRERVRMVLRKEKDKLTASRRG